MGMNTAGINSQRVLIGYASVRFVAGAPVYGTNRVAGIFNANVAITDNGNGDSSLRLIETLTGAHPALEVTQVEVLPRGAAVGSALKSNGWVYETVGGFEWLRITTLQEAAAGAASVLTDWEFDVFVYTMPSLPPL